MKCFLFFPFLIIPFWGYTTDVRITVHNLTKHDIVYKTKTGDINKAFMISAQETNLYAGTIIKPGETIYFRTSFYFFTGVEGSVVLGTTDNKYQFAVNFNNPYIGASEYSQTAEGPFSWKVVALDKNYGLGEQFYQLELVSIDPPPAKIAISSFGNGVIKGAIRWANDVGNPGTALIQDAFKVTVHVPQYFQPLLATAPDSKTYNGQNGRFEGQQNAGSIQWNLQAIDNYTQLEYSVSGVPQNVPLIFDITCRDNIKWIPGPGKLAPADANYTYVVGSFPVNDNVQNTIIGNATVLSGIDFECTGDWLKVDANGNIIGNDIMVNKIANRKNAPVLPGGMITAVTVTKAASTAVMQPAATQTNQMQTKQVQGAAVQKVRIRN